MAEKSLVPWCDASWSPWLGCHDAGLPSGKCRVCYRGGAYFKRAGRNPNLVVRASDRTFRLPLRLKPGTSVFVCPLSDFFIEEADGWRWEAWQVMYDAVKKGVGPFIIPTSRPHHITVSLPTAGIPPYNEMWKSIWFLVSVANQADADQLLPELLKVHVGHLGVGHEPATGRLHLQPFLRRSAICSCERAVRKLGTPQVEPDFDVHTGCPECGQPYSQFLRHIECLITGGCNHVKDFAWHMPIEAARADRDQAAAAGIPFFFKGHGEWMHGSQWRDDLPDPYEFVYEQSYYQVGRKATGSLLDGQRHESLPWRPKP